LSSLGKTPLERDKLINDRNGSAIESNANLINFIEILSCPTEVLALSELQMSINSSFVIGDRWKGTHSWVFLGKKASKVILAGGNLFAKLAPIFKKKWQKSLASAFGLVLWVEGRIGFFFFLLIKSRNNDQVTLRLLLFSSSFLEKYAFFADRINWLSLFL